MTPSLEGPCGKPAVSLSRRLGRCARPALVLAGLVLGGLVLGGLCGPGPASADELTDEQENDAIVYAWDNAVFTLYHEIGHMLIDLYKIPVLAKEEDGADNLATLMALEDYNRDGDPIIMDAAYGWAAWMKEDDFTRMTAGDFYDEHSISTQRAFWMICMLVGSNKPEFGEIATRFGLSDDRQDLCADEYEKTKRSWDAVMAPHAKPNAGKPKVSFRYGKPGDATVDGRDILADNTVLETVAKRIDSLYTLPVPVTLKGEDCETPNAFYDPADHTITLCYEMVQQYYDQYRNALLAGADPTSVEPRSRFTVTFGAMTLGAVAVGQAPAANAPEDLSQKGSRRNRACGRTGADRLFPSPRAWFKPSPTCRARSLPPMTRTLVLVRHGQSEWNLKNLFTGWKDPDLTEKGVEEARLAGRLLKASGLHFGTAFTSDLFRAQRTLQLILDEQGQVGIPTIRDQALNERDYGDLSGLNKDDARAKWGEEQVHLWRRSYDVAPPGGESLKDTGARVWPYYIHSILPRVLSGDNVIVAAHGNSLRAMVMALEGLSPADIVAREIETGVPLVYRLNSDSTVAEKEILHHP